MTKHIAVMPPKHNLKEGDMWFNPRTENEFVYRDVFSRWMQTTRLRSKEQIARSRARWVAGGKPRNAETVAVEDVIEDTLSEPMPGDRVHRVGHTELSNGTLKAGPYPSGTALVHWDGWQFVIHEPLDSLVPVERTAS